MKIGKVLILGSTLLTEKVVDLLKDHYDLIGYVPSKNPTKQGKINLPEKSLDTKCDLRLSIQYDRILKNTKNSFNLHTGLLPLYGGTNLLDYTLLNKEKEQGLTFHKMTEKLDYGPIISKISYPVLPNDKVVDLYKRMLLLAPTFALSSLKILNSLPEEQINKCVKHVPILYRRGEFKISKELQKL